MGVSSQYFPNSVLFGLSVAQDPPAERPVESACADGSFWVAIQCAAQVLEEVNMTAKLSHIIEFVADMDRAIKFYRDVIGLPLKFQAAAWSEFATGDITLALHPASENNPAGTIEMGFNVPDLQRFHTEMTNKGVQFSVTPAKQDFGGMLAQFIDSEGAHISVSGS
jgi:lactoylglutathione lyase